MVLTPQIKMFSFRARATAVLVVSMAALSFFPSQTTASIGTFVYGGCSQPKYSPGSSYEGNVNSILTSLVNSASFTLFFNSTVNLGGSPVLYGLFQCRGDLSASDCFQCVSGAVAQMGTLCVDSAGAVFQLEGCFVKYDNVTFIGKEDKTLVLKKCGQPVALDPSEMAQRDTQLDYLTAGYPNGGDGAYKAFRVNGVGDVYTMAQCVQDMSAGECQDCLGEAIGRLKTECGVSAWGDMYLAKCYARFNIGGANSHGGNGGNALNKNDNEIEKTLAILIGLIAGISLLIVFLSFLRKLCDRGERGGK